MKGILGANMRAKNYSIRVLATHYMAFLSTVARPVILSLVLVFCCLPPVQSFGQSPDAAEYEYQVPFDRDGRFLEIDAGMAKDMAIFSQYQAFSRACLFQSQDSSLALEVYYQSPEGRIIKRRVPCSRTELVDIRFRLEQMSWAYREVYDVSALGRSKMVIYSGILGATYYGWAIPTVAGVKTSDAGFIPLYLMITGGSFVIPYLSTSETSLRTGAVNFYSYGISRGLVHGIALHALLGKDESETDGELTWGVLGSLGEGLLGYHLANKFKISPGEASVFCTGADFGLVWGTAIAVENDWMYDVNSKELASCLLIGTAVGGGLGVALNAHAPYSEGDAILLSTSGILGAYLPYTYFEAKDIRRKPAGVLIGGSIAGLAVGHFLANGRSYSPAEGTTVQVWTLGWGLAGWGIPFIMSDGEESRENLFAYSAASSTFGYILSNMLYRPDATPRHGNTSTIDLDIFPTVTAAWDETGISARPVPAFGIRLVH